MNLKAVIDDLSAQVKNLLASATDTKVKEQITGLETKISTELTNANTKITEQAAEILKLQGEAAKAKTDHEAALEAKETEVAKRAHTQATQTIAKTGISPVAEEDPNAPKVAKTSDQLWAEYKTLKTDADKRKFYLENKANM